LKRYIHIQYGFFPLAVLATAWGVFLIEDGLFNAGSADAREFAIGLGFAVPALTFTLQRICRQDWFTAVYRWLWISALLLLSVAYSASIYLRWLDRREIAQFASSNTMIIGHVKSLDEWIMIDQALLQRPAHWYESGVQVTYLTGNDQQLSSIQLPVKFLPLKSIKEM